MIDISRRNCIIGGSAALMFAATGARAAMPSRTATLRLDRSKILNYLPTSYNGFSVEEMALTEPQIYAASNHSLVNLFRSLTPNGVLRVGGNSSEFCWWKPTPDAKQPVTSTAGQGRADNWMPQHFYAITPKAVDNLRGFLDATGWRCIYGLNFGTGDPASDAAHAAYVAKALGPRLLYFQIGNEPDFYREANNRLRAPGWDFDDYLREWMAIADAVSAAVPQARFGGPDVGASSDWIARFGREAIPQLGDRLLSLTGHYYAEGPPDSPEANITNLLKTDPRIAERMAQIMPVARAERLGFRMSEGNSCYRGGKPGMSNAFASTLWGLDYMLEMASLGCSGMNLHGGGGASIAASLGGKLPGARTAADQEIAKLGSFYSPFAGNLSVGYHARPIFYGMLAVQQFVGSNMIGCDLDAGNVNATAYASETGTDWRIALINKDADNDLNLDLEMPAQARSARLWRLTGPALDATNGVTLAGSAIDQGDNSWSPKHAEPVTLSGKSARVSLPRASAAILFVDRKTSV